jgi:hypothetical protein
MRQFAQEGGKPNDSRPDDSPTSQSNPAHAKCGDCACRRIYSSRPQAPSPAAPHHTPQDLRSTSGMLTMGISRLSVFREPSHDTKAVEHLPSTLEYLLGTAPMDVSAKERQDAHPSREILTTSTWCPQKVCDETEHASSNSITGQLSLQMLAGNVASLHIARQERAPACFPFSHCDWCPVPGLVSGTEIKPQSYV